MAESKADQSTFKVGDRVSVKPEHDVPHMFRPDGKPTTGEIRGVYDDTFIVWVSIGGAGVDEHSQAVPYTADQLAACPPHDFQWHPSSDDFGVCSLCGHEATEEEARADGPA